MSGPSFTDRPDYPVLRVVDFQVLGALNKPAGYFDVRWVTVLLKLWDLYNLNSVGGQNITSHKAEVAP